jgi:hypothetical protein
LQVVPGVGRTLRQGAHDIDAPAVQRVAPRQAGRCHCALFAQHRRELSIAAGTLRLLYDPAEIAPGNDVAPPVQAVPSHQRQRLVDSVQLAQLRKAQPQVSVVIHCQLLIERPHLL